MHRLLHDLAAGPVAVQPPADRGHFVQPVAEREAYGTAGEQVVRPSDDVEVTPVMADGGRQRSPFDFGRDVFCGLEV
ncbi:hypothetical protein ACFQYP_40380 [Nonomuraea antimicrobica]